VRYPVLYVLFVLLAALDLILTWIVLQVGGTEVNPVAEGIIAHRGLPGVVAFKFGLVLLIIAMCEVIGGRRIQVGRKLAAACVVVTAVPVLAACAQLGAERLERSLAGAGPPRRVLEIPAQYASRSSRGPLSTDDPDIFSY